MSKELSSMSGSCEYCRLDRPLATTVIKRYCIQQRLEDYAAGFSQGSLTGTGLFLSKFVPSPSRPLSFPPHDQSVPLLIHIQSPLSGMILVLSL
jgi:hypothetical protein